MKLFVMGGDLEVTVPHLSSLRNVCNNNKFDGSATHRSFISMINVCTE
jgi:hypothetical protein